MKKILLKIKGANPEVVKAIKQNNTDYNTYVKTGNIEMHDEMQVLSKLIYIEMMETNKVIIRKGKYFTTVYISNDKLMDSFQFQLMNGTFKGISLEY